MIDVESQPSKRRNAKQSWVDAVLFSLSECLRIHQQTVEALREGRSADIEGGEFFYELRASNGRRYTCGRVAQSRLEKAAEDALRRSRLSGALGFDAFFKILKTVIADRFITGRLDVSLSTVDSAFAGALSEAGRTRADSRHFIPCQLMMQPEPDSFSVGPVTFHNSNTFKSLGDELVLAHRKKAIAGGRRTTADEVLAYFGNFTWVADVTIKGCDRHTGQERATRAAVAAVDFIRVFFGHFHTRKMVVGGPGLPSDVRAKMEVRGGTTLLTYSVESTSNVGFDDGWSSMLQSRDAMELFGAAGRAIESITDPAIDRPLGLRFIDAAYWHGQAVRETSSAASIVKSVTALERLVTVVKGKDTARIVTERNAALSFDPFGEQRFDDLVAEMADIYNLRSRLVHGTLSPFDPEVEHRRRDVLKATETSLINGLARFDENGGFDTALSRLQLTDGFEHMVNRARRVDVVRATQRAIGD